MKILLAKPGLDGHDVGVKVLAHALKEKGFDVKYTGLRKSIEEIVERAKTEKADLIGLSILSGTHHILCEKMNEVMREKSIEIPWLVGGNIPAQDVEALERTGAKKAFPTGTKIETVIEFIKSI
jgi:methylmalonyl-CoA mutase, C-terminal domain